MSVKGLLLTTPGRNLFWFPCEDADAGFAAMNDNAFVYGAAWGHAKSKLEFGTLIDNKFTASEVVNTGWGDAPTPTSPITPEVK